MRGAKVFELAGERRITDGEIARVAGLHPSTISRIRAGILPVNARFIAGALTLLPDKNYEELFGPRSEPVSQQASA